MERKMRDETDNRILDFVMYFELILVNTCFIKKDKTFNYS